MMQDDLEEEWCALEIRPDEFYIVIDNVRVFGMTKDAAVKMANTILNTYQAYAIQEN